MTPSDFALSEEDLSAIVGDVWTSFLGDGLVPAAVGARNAPPAGPAGLLGTVSIMGDWQGHVVVEVTATCARAIAAVLLDEPPESVEEEDLTDALGELVNMIGGNVKSQAPPPSALSLPLVLRGGAAAAPETRPVCRTSWSWRNESIVVTVLAAVDSATSPIQQGMSK